MATPFSRAHTAAPCVPDAACRSPIHVQGEPFRGRAGLGVRGRVRAGQRPARQDRQRQPSRKRLLHPSPRTRSRPRPRPLSRSGRLPRQAPPAPERDGQTWADIEPWPSWRPLPLALPRPRGAFHQRESAPLAPVMRHGLEQVGGPCEGGQMLIQSVVVLVCCNVCSLRK